MHQFIAMSLCLGLLLPAVAEAQYALEYVTSWPSGPNQYDLTVAPNGNVYVIDINDGDVRYFSPDGQVLGQWAPPGTPVGISIDEQGIVHVAGLGVIRRYTAAGSFLSSIPVAAPTTGVALDMQGNVYTASGGPGESDTTAGVRKYDAAGRYQLRFSAPDPRMIYVDDNGNVFVTNGAQHYGANNSPLRVQKFSPTGQLLEETTGSGGCDEFNILWGIAGDGYGNVAAVNVRWPIPEDAPNLMLVSDSLTCIMAWHLEPPPGDPDAGVFLDVAFDRFGNLYVADTAYHRILKYHYTKIEPIVPPTLSLAPPRPNPSSGRVSIDFSTQVAGPAKLDVYDVAGRRVMGWQWPVLAAGPHRVEWDGQDDKGRSIGPGTLFYRLTSNGARVGNKLIQLR